MEYNGIKYVALIVVFSLQFCQSIYCQVKEGNLEYSARIDHTNIFLYEPIVIYIILHNTGSVTENTPPEISRRAGTLSISIIDPEDNEIRCKPELNVSAFNERILTPSNKVVYREILIGGQNGYYFKKTGQHKIKISIYNGSETAIDLPNLPLEVKKTESSDLMALEILEKIWASYSNLYSDGWQRSTQAQIEWTKIYSKYPTSIYSKYALYAQAMIISYSNETNGSVDNDQIINLLRGVIDDEVDWQLWPESVLTVANAYRGLGRNEEAIILVDWLDSKGEKGVEIKTITNSIKNDLLNGTIDKILDAKHNSEKRLSIINVIGINIIVLFGIIVSAYIGYIIGLKRKKH